VLGWFQGQDHQTTAQRADGPVSVFDAVKQVLDPNGAAIASNSPDPMAVSDTGAN